MTALAVHLAFGQSDVLADRSPFRDVQRVPGGHALLLGPDGVAVEPVSCLRVGLREKAPVVRPALAEAVTARGGDRSVSANLAGLDSTTLACLAAHQRPVTAVTFAPINACVTMASPSLSCATG